MPGIYSQEGARNYLADSHAYYNTTYHLFKNNLTPGQATVLGDVTEADYSGYAGGIQPTGWSVPITTAGHAKATANLLQWTHNGGATDNLVYGYYQLDPNGNLLKIERFATPILMQLGSPPLQIIPVDTIISEYLS